MALEQSLAQLSLATVSSPESEKALPTKSLVLNQNRQNCHPSSCFVLHCMKPPLLQT